MHALSLETVALSQSFGDFVALDQVSLRIRAGTLHALLGENGAGKSTLVKAVVGFQPARSGAVVVDGREQPMDAPAQARRLGIGMVYQHFTLVPGMSVAENLVLARGDLPAVVDWKALRAELQAFMREAPFAIDLDATPNDLSVGEKQKLEILKQLFLRPRLLILDEPTSVLNPQEADEVLGALRDQAHAGECTILMITHKFREVTAFADDVSVLRRGRLTHSSAVADSTPEQLAEAMVGEAVSAQAWHKAPVREAGSGPALSIQGLCARGDRGEPALQGLSLQVQAGEILGLAGVSGNGQRELLQVIAGQRPKTAGEISVAGQDYSGTREQNRDLQVRCLPEEPLFNACVPDLSVAENMALRRFDQAPMSRWGHLRWRAIQANARRWIDDYRIKAPSADAAMRQLSGGNVQRAVLARELSDAPRLLLVSNPTFGLDFAATADIHRRLIEVRNAGGAVLLISEDLDEILQLADRIAVISEGQIVHSVLAEQTTRSELGRHMAGVEDATSPPHDAEAVTCD